jgi:hypothetical protein
MIYTIIIAVLAALVYLLKQAGRTAAENEQLKEVLDEMEKANKARADLDRDPAVAERVRERFTR